CSKHPLGNTLSTSLIGCNCARAYGRYVPTATCRTTGLTKLHARCRLPKRYGVISSASSIPARSFSTIAWKWLHGSGGVLKPMIRWSVATVTMNSSWISPGRARARQRHTSAGLWRAMPPVLPVTRASPMNCQTWRVCMAGNKQSLMPEEDRTMKRHNGKKALLAALALSAAPLAFGVGSVYDSNPETLPGAVSGEEAIGTIEEREDDSGAARDEAEHDMHGASVDDTTPTDAGSPYTDLEPDTHEL